MNVKYISIFLIAVAMLLSVGCGSKSDSQIQKENTDKKSSATSPAILLAPVDRANEDASFTAFREELRNAVKRRDSKYILSIVDKNITNSFGGEDGIKEFKKIWKLDQPDSNLWKELEVILSLGGSFTKSDGRREFCAPYTFTDYPDNVDYFEHSAIIDKDVKVYEKPDSSAGVITKLSYNIVPVDYGKSIHTNSDNFKYQWVMITTPEGKQGYVDGSKIRNSLEYRACFAEIQLKWKMTALVAGD